jgi:hypothetical protein
MKIVSIKKAQTLQTKSKTQLPNKNAKDQLSKYYLESLMQINEIINQHYEKPYKQKSGEG